MPENTETSKTSKAQQKAVQRYVKNNYDRVVLTLPKGKMDLIKEHSKNNNESMNVFINKAIDKAMKKN